LVNDQLDAQFFMYLFIYIFNSLHVSSTSYSSSGDTSCFNTTSGSCHSVSVAVSSAGRKFTSDLQTLVIYQESLNDARSTKYKILLRSALRAVLHNAPLSTPNRCIG